MTSFFDNEMKIKLYSTSLMLLVGKEKINSYLKSVDRIVDEMNEDELALNYFSLYFEENEEELINTAKESCITSYEADLNKEAWLNLNEQER